MLIQTILGITTTLGVILAGISLRKQLVIRNVIISTAIICQVRFITFYKFMYHCVMINCITFQISIAIIAMSILFMSFVMGYKNLCILSGLYGFGFGSFRFSFKMLALECIKSNFSKIWSYIHGAEAMPILISVPLTIFLNDYSMKYGRAGYYICSAAAAIAAITLFFINHSTSQYREHYHYHHYPLITNEVQSHFYENSTAKRERSMSNQHMNSRRQNCENISQQTACDFGIQNFLNRSCISLNQIKSGTSMDNLQRKASVCCHQNKLADYSQSQFGRIFQDSCMDCNNYYLQRSLSFLGNTNSCACDKSRQDGIYHNNDQTCNLGQSQ